MRSGLQRTGDSGFRVHRLRRVFLFQRLELRRGRVEGHVVAVVQERAVLGTRFRRSAAVERGAAFRPFLRLRVRRLRGEEALHAPGELEIEAFDLRNLFGGCGADALE